MQLDNRLLIKYRDFSAHFLFIEKYKNKTNGQWEHRS